MMRLQIARLRRLYGLSEEQARAFAPLVYRRSDDD